jgi:FtsP/CotA-like multicopper oxidase with cupredoxin domain
MHLHGHDFRVVNSQGEYSPLKNVIDIMPMETDTIEFAANQSGNWFFHCHILFHMMAGMGRVFTYTNSPLILSCLMLKKLIKCSGKHRIRICIT